MTAALRRFAKEWPKYWKYTAKYNGKRYQHRRGQWFTCIGAIVPLFSFEPLPEEEHVECVMHAVGKWHAFRVIYLYKKGYKKFI